MNAMKRIFGLLLLAVIATTTIAMPTPLPNNERAVTSQLTVNSGVIISGPACNDVDEIVSSDPCKPLCICRQSQIYCAQITCSVDGLPMKDCMALPLNSKCCASYLCTSGNSTGDVHYPLPVLIIPPEMNLASLPSSKNDLLRNMGTNPN
ncbi:hypothetical protein RvY_13716 [Ramazzottius varieornatus]|uniref:VWFC domain-containing protein n=1 Tax=Ramazzottius varieornatus TaxID=947166 RepID=A0A1D1VU25_RAMVA|nr:hypothetical protein RvY_13716 [Ramazzottius varieornatus]